MFVWRSLVSISITYLSMSFRTWMSALFFIIACLDVGWGLEPLSESSSFYIIKNPFYWLVSAVAGSMNDVISNGLYVRPRSSSLFFWRLYLSSKLYWWSWDDITLAGTISIPRDSFGNIYSAQWKFGLPNPLPISRKVEIIGFKLHYSGLKGNFEISIFSFLQAYLINIWTF